MFGMDKYDFADTGGPIAIDLDTDTLDLDPRSFSTRLDEIEFESLSKNEEDQNNQKENANMKIKEILIKFEEVLNAQETA